MKSRSLQGKEINGLSAALGLIFFGLFAFVLGHFTSQTELTEAPSSSLRLNVDEAAQQQIQLQTHLGETVLWGDLAGQPRLVFFGYTFCPDVCPMGLANLSDALNILDGLGHVPLAMFATYDPSRDTVDVMNDYVTAFHDDLLGLTGQQDQMAALAHAFRAFSERSDDTVDDEFYLIDHTSYIYLIGADGNLLDYYPDNTSPDDLAAKIASELRN